jgi:hypothetical protein
VLLIISCFEFLISIQIKNYSNDNFYGARVEVIMARSSGVQRDFFGEVQKILLRTEDRQSGDMRAVAP